MADSQDKKTANWYVIHTYSGYESKVARNLEKIVGNKALNDLISDVRVPIEKVIELKDNKKSEVERKVFPGYVLVKMVMNDDSWYIVRNTRGVTGFVGPASKPVALTEEEVDALGLEKKEIETQIIEVDYKVGDSVEISAGPLEGFVGVVEEIDTSKNKVKVVVSMFGRETPVELSLDQAKSL